MKKRGQLTIFIIFAIALVVLSASYFVFRDKINIGGGIPANVEPIYTTFLNCLEEDTAVGISVLESQGGYIDIPDFEPGSRYMPFSNQLNFLGNPIPYWYYVSGNNIEKEEVPTIIDMQGELADFVEDKISRCRFDKYYEEGFEIKIGEPEIKIRIKDEEVSVNLDMDLIISKDEEKTILNNHNVDVKSRLGSLYNSAKKIYDYEQETLFLENYAVDTLRFYAPVDGVEITCSPKIWVADEVFDELHSAIVANTLALKSGEGGNFLKKQENSYFITDLPVEEEVRFLASKNWPSGFEVNPTDGNLLIASPVGNQPGLGILGFCYVPYHFVYNVRYPVLVQITSGSEIFQFPLAVILEGNRPREALETESVNSEVPPLCDYKNTLVEVNTYDTKLNPVSADISYECFGVKCDIGKTTITQSLEKEFPQCVNGYIIAKSEGYLDSKYLYSTTESGSVDIILDPLYEMEIDLKIDGKSYSRSAIISFVSDRNLKTILYPDQKKVNLSEGQYEVSVFVYKNSSLKLEPLTKEECFDVPQTGVGGLFGLTEKKCYTIEIPSQIISNALSGGGKENYYILESELDKSNIIEIYADSLPTPTTIEKLSENYILFEEKDLDIYFK